VSSVSNWGGWGLVSAMAMVVPQDAAVRLLADFTLDRDRAYLEAAVDVGQAVDDSRIDRRPATIKMSVDRLSWEQHAQVLGQLRAHVDGYLGGLPRSWARPPFWKMLIC
jgi:D-glutamate cyclase